MDDCVFQTAPARLPGCTPAGWCKSVSIVSQNLSAFEKSDGK